MADLRDDHRLEEAKTIPIGEIVDRLEIGNLKRGGVELIGPCPQCGGTDRFGVNLRKGLFQCRRCGEKGDGIHLAMWMRGMTLPQALDWLVGAREGISDAERAARRAKSAAARAKAEAAADKYRASAISAARALLAKSVPAEETPVRDYLTRRGIPRTLLPEMPHALRYLPECPFMVPDGGHWREVHRGPAMIAVIKAPDGSIAGAHRTWIDLNHPKGKAQIVDPASGEVLGAKKTLGAKKGGAIRLRSPKGIAPVTMVMGEGIETTLTALISGVYPQAAFWCGIDLGNMAGRREQGKGLRYAGRPDLGDTEAFVPPSAVERLIYVMDGDSEPRLTRAHLEAGLRRAMVLRPGLRGQIVQAPEGKDLNDLVMGLDDDGQCDRRLHSASGKVAGLPRPADP